MGVGIDLVTISSIKDPELFSKGILSEEEYNVYLKREKKLEFLASRFAAKEAFLKACGKGILGFDLKEISVINKESGQPVLIYKNVEYTNVSISHEKEYAIAIVII